MFSLPRFALLSLLAAGFSSAVAPMPTLADDGSPFATSAPNATADGTNEAPSGPATPKPTVSNAPAIIMSQYAPFLKSGKGSASGRVTMTTQTGRQFPAAQVPIYLLPATSYTAWYVGLHDDEFLNALKRAHFIRHGGIRGMMDHKVAVEAGLPGLPDLTQPIAFTPIDERVFHTVRVSKTDGTGRYRFSGIPAGRYYVLTHWPIVIDQTTAQTNGFGIGFGGVENVQSTTTVSTTFYHYLMAFSTTKPIDVTDGRNSDIGFTPTNGFMSFNPCGTLPCSAFAIDQWLPTADRL